MFFPLVIFSETERIGTLVLATWLHYMRDVQILILGARSPHTHQAPAPSTDAPEGDSCSSCNYNERLILNIKIKLIGDYKIRD